MMAVPSSSTASSGKKGRLTRSDIKKPKPEEEADAGVVLPPPASKRNKSPGVRLVGSRIYDSENGKTCHQCRQKTMDFVAACKKENNGKTCTIKFCHKCLLNRYGEKAEEMAVLEDWNCPKCRGICNCSFCMKKRGHQPTGILVHTAKATGFTNVSELLNVKGPENVARNKVTKDVDIRPTKATLSKNETVVPLPIKRGKENATGNVDPPVQSSLNVKKAKKLKREALKDAEDRNQDVKVSLTKTILPPVSHSEEMQSQPLQSSPKAKKAKKMKIEALKDREDINQDDKVSLEKITPSPISQSKAKEAGDEDNNAKGVTNKPCPSKLHTGKEKVTSTLIGCKNNTDKKLSTLHQIAAKLEGVQSVNDGKLVESFGGHTKKIKLDKKQVEQLEPEITLPEGNELTTVVGISIPPEDIGHALQFLEFCAAFKEILDLKKGEAGHILRELIRGGRTRCGKYSPVVRFHVQLLSLIQEDFGEESPLTFAKSGEHSWMHALQNCASRSKGVLEKLELEGLCQEPDCYDSLDSSKKLRVLTFLCDEVLCTGKIRSWMDDQHLENVEKVKEAKEKVTAARHKEKQIKQKMQDEVAKAIIAKNGSSLSISEHEAIVSQIKIEAAQAHAEFLQSTEVFSDVKQISDAVRIEPILRDAKGHTYWKFEGYSDDSSILMQDVGQQDTVESGEKWFTFNAEQEKEIDNYISSSRKRKRLQSVKC